MARRAVIAIAAVGVLAGCNDAAGIETRTRQPDLDYPTFGSVPELVTNGPEAELTRCEVVGTGSDEVLAIEVIVTNTSSRARRPARILYTVTAGDGRVWDDEQIGGSGDIGPGRQARFTEEMTARTALAGSVCELGEVSWQPADRPGFGSERVDAGSVELRGCHGSTLSVTNPFDRPAGVAVTVEYFDADGYSVHRESQKFTPEIIDDRSQGGSGRHEEGGTVAPGQSQLFNQAPYGDAVGCAVIEVVAELDPEPDEIVIVG